MRSRIRLPRRADARMVPRQLTDDGLFEVDATWGTVQPIEVAPGVRTRLCCRGGLRDWMTLGFPTVGESG